MFVQPPRLLRFLFRDAYWRMKTNEKVVFLTFDDGPTPKVTEQVLSLLEQYNAKATFFCIGNNVKKHPAIFQQIIDAGHCVANHTHNHLKGWKTKNEDYYQNINKCSEFIDSQLFRPPYGQLKQSQYSYLMKHYRIIMWDIITWDFDQKKTPEQCTKHVLGNIRKGSIVVYHDSKKAEKNCIESLQQVLPALQKQGYQFHSLDGIA